MIVLIQDHCLSIYFTVSVYNQLKEIYYLVIRLNLRLCIYHYFLFLLHLISFKWKLLWQNNTFAFFVIINQQNSGNSKPK